MKSHEENRFTHDINRGFSHEGKKWVDCPTCGSKGTIKYVRNRKEVVEPQGYGKIIVKNLDGYFCSACGDGFYTRKSMNLFNSAVAYGKARQDSHRVVVGDLLEVSSVAGRLDVTSQRVHQMMKEGKLHYVIVGKYRIPTRRNEKIFPGLRKKIHENSKHRHSVHRNKRAVWFKTGGEPLASPPPRRSFRST
ncbi:MAG TPA: YgiT-type zinc finger protein [Spirochaetota bacterium]|nr:YgiT-type zinc finger protein [Spirochaetota bacterium]